MAVLGLLCFAAAGVAEDTAPATTAHVQDGVCTVSSGDGGTKTVTCTFKKPFGKVPTVIATPLSESDSDYDDVFCLTIRKVTTTNFVANIRRVDEPGNGWGQILRLSYHAAE